MLSPMLERSQGSRNRLERVRTAQLLLSDAPMRKVRDIMEPDVFWLAADAPLTRAAEALAERQISGAPVCEADGKIVGMFTKTELADYYGSAHEARLVREVMTPTTVSVRPDDDLERAIQLMAFEGIHRVLVLDGQRLEGIVTSMDVLRELAGFPRREHRVIAVAPPP
jgi:predicted transcriptional regulator